jgi:hypothetical protein
MRQTLEQFLGPSCAQYLADLHATDRQSHLIHYVWTHESGPVTPAEADAFCFHEFSCLPNAVEPTAPAENVLQAFMRKMKQIYMYELQDYSDQTALIEAYKYFAW